VNEAEAAFVDITEIDVSEADVTEVEVELDVLVWRMRIPSAHHRLQSIII